MTFSQPDQEALKRCCGSTAWLNQMAKLQPFRGRAELLAAADQVWNGLTAADWLEAFAAHPKIGQKTSSEWCATEQRGMDDAGASTRARMAELNAAYEKKFGWIFIVCAMGKGAGEMLEILSNRIDNDPESELQISAAEQAKITKLRLEKLLAE
jgi:OHCU decarboxylase